ncbi:hypothetical protein [Aquibacillus rhizosphaerae]|uniref:Spore coat protein n=1 Tax=Aquibacillus rhizosphaerae TaxID=3051431 RepID=A0ABT7L583_9BACI|nr:hypothetical protein [Aquibacillus sp. LR5S19]MDL4839755.1 hypothetical protein [Aquibacillus sp. LR5S19]
MSNKEFQSVDMLLDSIFKKHGVNLDKQKIDAKEKEALKGIVDNLKKSVDEVLQEKKETKDS